MNVFKVESLSLWRKMNKLYDQISLSDCFGFSHWWKKPDGSLVINWFILKVFQRRERFCRGALCNDEWSLEIILELNWTLKLIWRMNQVKKLWFYGFFSCLQWWFKNYWKSLSDGKWVKKWNHNFLHKDVHNEIHTKSLITILSQTVLVVIIKISRPILKW